MKMGNAHDNVILLYSDIRLKSSRKHFYTFFFIAQMETFRPMETFRKIYCEVTNLQNLFIIQYSNLQRLYPKIHLVLIC